MTSKEDIRRWIRDGVRQGATHVIVVCDSFDHDDYPVYVKPGEDPKTKVSEYEAKPMQSIMEVYALHLDTEAQLSEPRSFHVEPKPKRAKKTDPTKKGTFTKAIYSGGQVSWATITFNVVPHGWQADVEVQYKGTRRPAKGSVCRDWADTGPSAKKLVTKLITMGKTGKP